MKNKYDERTQVLVAENRRMETISKIISKHSNKHRRSISDAQKRRSGFTENTSELKNQLIEIINAKRSLKVYIPNLSTKHLLMLKGYALSPEDPVHCAYLDILDVYQAFGFGVQECNELLHSWEIDKKHFLGSFDLDEEM